MDFRRDLSGIPMMFDLIEMTEGLKVPLGDAAWDGLRTSATNIIALSTFIGNQFNVVSIIRSHQGLSVQASIKYAFSLVDHSFQKILSTESTLLSQEPVPCQTTSTWTWNPLNRRQPSEPTLAHVPLTSDSTFYLRGLKNCIVGTLNWSYETEVYFGPKGDEVRQSGWVFLKGKEGGWSMLKTSVQKFTAQVAMAPFVIRITVFLFLQRISLLDDFCPPSPWIHAFFVLQAVRILTPFDFSDLIRCPMFQEICVRDFPLKLAFFGSNNAVEEPQASLALSGEHRCLAKLLAFSAAYRIYFPIAHWLRLTAISRGTCAVGSLVSPIWLLSVSRLTRRFSWTASIS
ncbi:hypothetical protein MVEN_02609200 [Mycena venus]|uniref:Uncharacterized protein n=1 Tax=Mycena venus TaxID=2733690 RepID=A0A8H6U305_9AGAR|nr:hypothetical protein MVEN_02609200 [Mycena venus]